MKITMTKDGSYRAAGAQGDRVHLFLGQTYDVPDETAKGLIGGGSAVKAVGGPPEDKAVAGPPETKAETADGRCPTCNRRLKDLARHRERMGH